MSISNELFSRIAVPLLLIVIAPFLYLDLAAQQNPVDTFENSIGMKFANVPAGTFEMGSPESEAGRWEIEHLHPVTISKAFLLGIHEVTQDQFEQVMGFNPSDFSKTGGKAERVRGMDTKNFPVEWVSHGDALEFCIRLSGMPLEIAANRVYRLPTEAEWERACRAGKSSQVFAFGNTLSSQQANIRGDLPYGDAAPGPDLQRPTSVGSFPANAFGLYDMHGNVAEWCLDRYDENYYQSSPEIDPPGRLDTSHDARVIRGGSWHRSGTAARSAQRAPRPTLDKRFTTWRSNELGFRVVCLALNPSSTTDANLRSKETADAFRVWTATSGKQSKPAKIVSISKRDVKLEFKDKKSVTLPIAKLSKVDKQHVQDFRADLIGRVQQMLDPYRLFLRNNKLEYQTAVELNRLLASLAKAKQEIKKGEKAIEKINKNSRGLDSERFRLRQLYAEAEQESKRIPSNRVEQRNRAVGNLNSIIFQIDALELQAKAIADETRTTRNTLQAHRKQYFRLGQQIKIKTNDLQREQTNVGRSNIVEVVSREMRPMFDELTLNEPAVQKKSERIVAELESTVLSGNITLRQAGNTNFVTVEINDRSVEMVLDTGASLVTIPAVMATKLGLRPDSGSRRIELTIANGKQISATLMNLKMLRIGKFELNNIACAVLGPDAPLETPLLGMSVLEHFEMSLSGDQLELIQVNTK